MDKEIYNLINNLINKKGYSIKRTSDELGIGPNKVRDYINRITNDNYALSKNMEIIKNSLEDLDDINLRRFNLCRITPHRQVISKLFENNITTLKGIKDSIKNESLYNILRYNQVQYLEEMLYCRLNIDLNISLDKDRKVIIKESTQITKDIVEFYIKYKFNYYIIIVRKYNGFNSNNYAFYYHNNIPNKSDKEYIEEYLMEELNKNIL